MNCGLRIAPPREQDDRGRVRGIALRSAGREFETSSNRLSSIGGRGCFEALAKVAQASKAFHLRSVAMREGRTDAAVRWFLRLVEIREGQAPQNMWP
jgi:hypothetical protein